MVGREICGMRTLTCEPLHSWGIRDSFAHVKVSTDKEAQKWASKWTDSTISTASFGALHCECGCEFCEGLVCGGEGNLKEVGREDD